MSQEEIKETTSVAQENEDAGAPSENEAKKSETESSNIATDDTTADEEDLEAQLAFQTIKRNREKRKRRRIIILVVVAVLVLVGFILFITTCSGPKDDASSVAAMSVTGKVYKGDFSNTIKVNGSTEPNKLTIVSPEVDGIIENVQVAEGDRVNQGDVLFSIKNTDIERTISDAEKSLQSAREAADKANRAIDEAYATYNRAVDAYNASPYAAEVSFDAETYRAGITAAEEAYKEAANVVDEAQRARDDTIAKADKRTVRAPASGTLVSMTAVNGATVGTTGSSNSSGTPLAQIADLSQMKVTVQVNEADISSVKVGQEGTATFAAIPDLSLSATVQHISSISSGTHSGDSSMAGSAGSGGGVVTYSVDLIIPNPDPRLKPGMTATVSIVTDSVPDATIVPLAAVSDDENGGKQVMVIDNEKTGEGHAVSVEVVAKGSSEAAVRGELKDGDSVLLASAGDVSPTSSSSGAGSAV